MTLRDRWRAYWRGPAIADRLQSLEAGIDALRAQVSRLEATVVRAESPGLSDDDYEALVDKFRGSPDEIKRRLRPYLQFVERAAARTGNRRVLDLGCGRGEWLDLLRDGGYDGLGVDARSVLVERCKTRGLRVETADAELFVKAEPPDRWAVVSAFHLVEHTLAASLLPFFRNVLRILSPDGVLLLETPNTHNLLVGSGSFYLDPTHRRPIPPETWEFLLSRAGFVDITVLPLNPASEHVLVETGSVLEGRFNHLIYGPRDLGLVAARRGRGDRAEPVEE
jgi:O-antigen chain-terminating methyltransferase